jgi:hypothetical protein
LPELFDAVLADVGVEVVLSGVLISAAENCWI